MRAGQEFERRSGRDRRKDPNERGELHLRIRPDLADQVRQEYVDRLKEGRRSTLGDVVGDALERFFTMKHISEDAYDRFFGEAERRTQMGNPTTPADLMEELIDRCIPHTEQVTRSPIWGIREGDEDTVG